MLRTAWSAATGVHLAPLLVIDEMDYIPFGEIEATVFFQLGSKRYEKNIPIILTSNKPFGDRGSILGDQVIATAVLDRLPPPSTFVERATGSAKSERPGSSDPQEGR